MPTLPTKIRRVWGKLARLLPSLDGVAMCQIPSLESNPKSPSPINATVGQNPSVDS